MLQLRGEGVWPQRGESGWVLGAIRDLGQSVSGAPIRGTGKVRAGEMQQMDVLVTPGPPSPFSWGGETSCLQGWATGVEGRGKGQLQAASSTDAGSGLSCTPTPGLSMSHREWGVRRDPQR